ncbi:MAG: TetR/AcrR family transcriptional regulator [Solirubrobacterales bacterium]|nr:TetR/AcrR family transcriptional regulator [Solirubrobacterales bacterium]
MHPSVDTAHSPRPLRADAQRNRARILEAAQVEFAENGGEAQIDAIAARAGVGVGTFYRHFPTKEALVERLVRERFEAMADDASAALEIEDPWAAFAGLMYACGERCEQDAGTQHLFLVVGPDAAERLAVETGLHGRSQKLIDRGVASGAVRADFRAEEIGMLMCGLSSTMGSQKASWDWRRHLEIVLDGLRARPA